MYLGGLRNTTITLPDGRRLGYAEYGDPDAMPVLYCHGFPSCRLEPSMLPSFRHTPDSAGPAGIRPVRSAARTYAAGLAA